jgi:hypothetical protein
MYQYVVQYNSVAIYAKNSVPARIWPDLTITTRKLSYIATTKTLVPSVELAQLLVSGLLL